MLEMKSMAFDPLNYTLKIGYVPLIDSAPLLVAEKEGLFEKHGVHVTLSEEVGWATVRDKLIHKELDMASTLLGLPYAMHNGVGCYQTSMSIPLIMNANGNTITLTKSVTKEMFSNPELLAATLNERAEPNGRKWTFATVNPYSSHLILLFQWLSKHLKNFISEIDIVFLPPQLFPDLLEKGMIDGFCAGEPWGTQAEANGSGWIVGDSISLNTNHPEKVLAVPKRTMDYHHDAVKSIGKALLEALELCDSEAYRDQLIQTLCASPAMQLSGAEIETCLTRQFKNQEGEMQFLHTFSGGETNTPTSEKEQWVLKGLKEAGLFRKKIIATGQIMNSEVLF